jgi:hypothetical protein
MTAVCSTATHLRVKKLLGSSVLMGQKVGFMDIVSLWGRMQILGHREVEEAWGGGNCGAARDWAGCEVCMSGFFSWMVICRGI